MIIITTLTLNEKARHFCQAPYYLKLKTFTLFITRGHRPRAAGGGTNPHERSYFRL
jgi:hypothetical protein